MPEKKKYAVKLLTNSHEIQTATGAAIPTVISQYDHKSCLRLISYSSSSSSRTLGHYFVVLVTMTLGTSMAAHQGTVAMAARQICLQLVNLIWSRKMDWFFRKKLRNHSKEIALEPGYHWTVELEVKEIQQQVENASSHLIENKEKQKNEDCQLEQQQKHLQNGKCHNEKMNATYNQKCQLTKQEKEFP
ncbi:hypothetical protein HYC85_026892 [Camellia sinensis]|uniref:Uncharacterized protein n=1 Tax=Camellia sinensis TaxID=4442 RepID=A0A7J7G4U4_CAMSI|nr:hypothetical protein HYC85_026892 [Camellia sinensis]